VNREKVSDTIKDLPQEFELEELSEKLLVRVSLKMQSLYW
jgi:hypothetical protein